MEVISKCISFLEDTHYRSQLGQKGEADSLCLFADLAQCLEDMGTKCGLCTSPAPSRLPVVFCLPLSLPHHPSPFS